MKSVLALFIVLITPTYSKIVLPDWTPTWNTSESTFLMPCNNTGYTRSELLEGWGVIDFDWSNAKSDWTNAKPMDCEERLIDQATIAKQINPSAKVFVYRNLVKALPWYSSVREKMVDPAYSGWFLKFNEKNNSAPYSVEPCTTDLDGVTKCSLFYHDHGQTPLPPRVVTTNPKVYCKDGTCDCGDGLPCGEYLWDHRNGTMLRDFLVKEYILGPNGLGNEAVDGFYLDDSWRNNDADCGAAEENKHCNADMGLTLHDVNDITSNWKITSKAVLEAIQMHKGFSLGGSSLFLNGGMRALSGKWGSDPRKTCAAWTRANCKKSSMVYTSPYLFTFTLNEYFVDPFPMPFVLQDIAQFLLVRGPFSWIGHGWMGCYDDKWTSEILRPKELDVDYGIPVDEVCYETFPNSGVFVRDWTRARVQLDCNTWEANIDMHGPEEYVQQATY